MTTITTNSEQTRMLAESLKAIPGAAAAAGARALNSVAAGLRKAAAEWVSTDYAIPPAAILDLLQVQRATASDAGQLEASVVGVGRGGWPLLEFVVGSKAAPSTTRTSGGGYAPAVGVPVLIRRADGQKPATGAFVAKMASSHVGVFARIAGSRKIAERKLPSPVGILDSGDYIDRVEDYVAAALPAALEAEISKALTAA